MESHETEPTKEGKDLIDRWRSALEEQRRAESRLNSAQCEVSNATNALGKWLVPGDAVMQEKFCIWYGDSLIEAAKKDQNSFSVNVRKRGRSLS